MHFRMETLIYFQVDNALKPGLVAHTWTSLSLPNYFTEVKDALKDLQIVVKQVQSQSTHVKVSKGAKIRNQYNQVPHLTQDTNGNVANSQLDTTNKSQEVSPLPAGDHKAHINRHAQT